jgi:hypothetical protein
MTDPFAYFDEIHCINLDSQPRRWDAMQRRFDTLGIRDRVRRFPAVKTPGAMGVGCALSHRRIIERAQADGLESVLVFEDDALFLEGADWVLDLAVRELSRVEWTLFYLGGFQHAIGDNRPGPRAAPDLRWIRKTNKTILTHAIAYHSRMFEPLLQELPESVEHCLDWVNAAGPIDSVLADRWQADAFHIWPSITTQEEFLTISDPQLKDQYADGVDGEHSSSLPPLTPPARTAAERDTASADPDWNAPRLRRLKDEYVHRPSVYRLDQPYHLWGPNGGVQRARKSTFRSGMAYRPVGGINPTTGVQTVSLPHYADFVTRTDRSGFAGRLVDDHTHLAHGDIVDGVSIDLLASAGELGFLSRSKVFERIPVRHVVDIGAGYGRMADHFCQALPGIASYACLDAVPESTYLSEFHLARRNFMDGRAEVVPLGQVDSLMLTRTCDLAVAARVFDQIPARCVAAWLDLLTAMDTRALFLVTARRDRLRSLELGGGHLDYSGLLRRRGFRVVHDESAASEPSGDPLVPEHYYLFMRERPGGPGV